MATKTKHKPHSRALALRPSSSRPTIIKMPAPIVKVKKAAKRHARHAGHMLGGLMNKERLGIVAGSFAVGFLQKQNLLQNLPSLPLIGKTGTIGLAAYLFSNGGRNRLADEICTAAFVLAANELATTGTVVGSEPEQPPDVGYVAGW